jgi:hypothetical protein
VSPGDQGTPPVPQALGYLCTAQSGVVPVTPSASSAAISSSDRSSSSPNTHELCSPNAGGGALRASVFGVSDGLVSNAALVMAFSGAQTQGEVVLLGGVGGLLAGAFSMGAGEYVSMRPFYTEIVTLPVVTRIIEGGGCPDYNGLAHSNDKEGERDASRALSAVSAETT